jgi:hypothetical protein
MRERIEKTVACKDCEYIPKVEDAGKIIDGYQIMHNGLKIIQGCYHGDWMSEIISRCKGHHEPQEEKAFYEVLNRINDGSTMIEVGSFWTYYSMWFNRKVKRAKNYMIDVDQNVLQIGQRNFELNNLKGEFFVDSVPNFNFSSFLESNKIQHVDILHADIQGWEYHLLEDCKSSLDKIGYIFVSTHTDQFTPGISWGSPRELLHEDCLKFLKDHGFIILCEHNMKESASNDGLIVAKNPKIDKDFNQIEVIKL